MDHGCLAEKYNNSYVLHITVSKKLFSVIWLIYVYPGSWWKAEIIKVEAVLNIFVGKIILVLRGSETMSRNRQSRGKVMWLCISVCTFLKITVRYMLIVFGLPLLWFTRIHNSDNDYWERTFQLHCLIISKITFFPRLFRSLVYKNGSWVKTSVPQPVFLPACPSRNSANTRKEKLLQPVWGKGLDGKQ